MSEATIQQFQLRLPSNLKESIENEASKNNRSVNAQILFMLQSYEESNGRLSFLPVDIKMRLEKYQTDNDISTESEAIQRLLNEALQSKDTIEDILSQLRAYPRRDLRAMARDILTTHPLVTHINISNSILSFVLKNKDKGMIDTNGRLCTFSYYDENDEPEGLRTFIPDKPDKIEHPDSITKKIPSSLDDEIPF